MTEGTMPSVYPETDAELAEEERPLHVGVTHARTELHLTWTTLNGRGWANRPSPYLNAHCVTFAPGALSERARALSGLVGEAAGGAGLASTEVVSPTAMLPVGPGPRPNQ